MQDIYPEVGREAVSGEIPKIVKSYTELSHSVLQAAPGYAEFLASKRVVVAPAGIEVALSDIHPLLFEFQRDIVRWALRKGRAAIFSDCGTGKTFMEIEWGRIICQYTGGDVLILAPLAVGAQTVAEGVKLGVTVTQCRCQADVRPGVNIANYEMLQNFDPDHFAGIILDESSILKSYMGKTKRALVDAFANTPYRLACTATPAPNDVMEIGNHSEFLGVMPSNEMLMRWFINDTMSNGKYRLKGHATKDFWAWVASWAISLRRPSDLGYSDDGFVLPDLRIERCYVETDITVGVEAGQLFRAPAMSATTLHKEMRITAPDRAQAVADLVNASHGILTLTGNTDKLAACGKKSTPNGDAQNTNRTPESGLNGLLKAEHPKTIGNICIPTTKPTKSNSTSTDEHTSTNATSGRESDTQTTPNIENECKQECAGTMQASLIRNAKLGYGADSASASRNTTLCSQNKMENAPSAANQKPTGTDTESFDSRLTTATKQGQSEDCSAQVATSASVNSETTLISCDEQQIMSPPNQKPEPWVIWCNTNYEQEELEKHFGNRAFSVYGSLSSPEKERRVVGWLNGERPILISKPSICGYGLNFQHCSHTAFVGLSYSFEDFYQAVRRLYRFGQKRPVECVIVAAETEAPLVATLERKMHAHMQMSEAMNTTARLSLEENRSLITYNPQVPMILPHWLKEVCNG